MVIKEDAEDAEDAKPINPISAAMDAFEGWHSRRLAATSKKAAAAADMSMRDYEDELTWYRFNRNRPPGPRTPQTYSMAPEIRQRIKEICERTNMTGSGLIEFYVLSTGPETEALIREFRGAKKGYSAG